MKNSHENITLTEDGVPVRTLYVGDIKPQIKHDRFVQYFAKYGKVEEVKYHEKPNFKFAFVTFEKVEEANAVLKRRSHFIQNNKVTVRAADTWHQPTPTPTDPEVKAESSNFVYDANLPSLEDLNDDCLLHILGYLNIIELTRVRGVSQRIDSVIDVLGNRYVEFDFQTVAPSLEMTLMVARDVLIFIGPITKKLAIDGDEFKHNSNRLLDFIARYCTVLESLEIDGFFLKKRGLAKLIPMFKNLNTFRVGDTTRLSDDIGICLQHAPNLKELEINGNYELSGRFLSKVNNLESLKLNNCGNLQSKFFVQALQHNTTLKKLEVQRCDKLNNKVAEAIVRDLKELEHLSISNSYVEMSQFAQLGKAEKLKQLTVEFHNVHSIDPLLNNLIEKNQLEHLTYIGSTTLQTGTVKLIANLTNLRICEMVFNSTLSNDDVKLFESLQELEEFAIPGASDVGNSSVLHIVKACKKLKFMDVSQTNVDNDLIGKLIELLKQDPERPLLKMVAFNTQILESMKNDELVLENKDKLELVFFPHSIEPSQFYLDDSDLDDELDDDDMFLDEDDFDDDDDFYGFNPYYDIDINEQWGFFDSDDDKYMMGWGNVDSPDLDDDFYF